MTLNEMQKKVVEDFDHNIVLFAGAGTGKTYTIAAKVKEAIARGVRPEEILCLTFTVKACREMREDILNACPEAEGVTVKTIHGFCLSLVTEEAARAAADYVSPAVVDDADEEEILSRLFSDRLARLRLSEFLARRTKLGSLAALFEKDVVYLPRSGFFWRVPTRQGAIYLNSETKYLTEERAEPYLSDAENEPIVCPACGEKTDARNFCAACGYDFRTYIAPARFELKRYRAIVSLVKRYREMYGFYSSSPAEDYQRTFEKLRGEPCFSGAVGVWTKEGAFEEDERFLEIFSPHAGELVAEYDGLLKQSNALDFDDLVLKAARLLRDGETLARLKKRYRFFIADEMQDTSRLEYSLLKKLFGNSRVMVCGDAFQTIYEWRGSDPFAILRDFKEYFRAVTYSFSENYRATKHLVGAAYGYLKNTYPAEDFGENGVVAASGEEGERVLLAECASEKEEAEYIYRAVLSVPHGDPSKTCVISRSNRYIAGLSRRLRAVAARFPEKERLRFFTADGDSRFFKKPVVKTFLAYYALLVNPFDRLNLERVCLRGANGIGSATLEKIRAGNPFGASVSCYLDLNAYASGDAYGELMRSLGENEVVVYDIETTGLDLSEDEIVQISAVGIDGEGNVLKTLNQMVVPVRDISEGATRTHGFTREYIASHGGVDARSALATFSEFVRGATLVGHNSIKFDRAIVDRQLKENALPPLPVRGEYDTMFLAKQFLPQAENYKLETLCALFGVVNERAHDAFSDVSATAKALAALVREKIFPTREERSALFYRYAAKFKPLAEEYAEMRALLAANDFSGLNRRIVAALNAKDETEREAVGDFVEIAEAAFSENGSAEKSVLRLLSDSSLAGSQLDLLLKRSQKIPVVTVHQSKGCEFDTVIVAGADDKNFPSFAAVRSGYGEEEKRVFFVAVSRAKKRLVLTYSTSGVSARGNVYSKNVSEYVSKIPSEHLERTKAKP